MIMVVSIQIVESRICVLSLSEGGSGTNDGHPYGPIIGIGVVAAR